MPFPDQVTPVITSDTVAGIGQIVRASGTLIVTCPYGAESGDMFTVKQVGTGVVTVAGYVNGSASGTQVTTQHAGVTLVSVGADKWATCGDVGNTMTVDGGTP